MKYEWFIVEIIVLGLLVAELIALRRSRRKDRDAAAAKRQAASLPE